jgi:hypothetical protein
MNALSHQDELSELSKRHKTNLFTMQKPYGAVIVSVTRHATSVLVHFADRSLSHRYRDDRLIKQCKTEREFRRWSARVKLEPFEPIIHTQKKKP